MSDPHRQTLLGSQDGEETASFRSSTDSSPTLSAAASPAVEINEQQTNDRRAGALTVLDGLAIVLGIQIGVGIFSIPSYVSLHVPSPGAGVLVWLLAGLLVWTGAASFVELGAAIPRNGGIQEYLRYSYGDFGGFMFSWTWISIGRPCSISLIAMIFAEHVNGLALPDGWAGGWVDKGMAMVGIWVITIVNGLGAYTGARVALGFLVLKISTILSIIGAGVVLGLSGKGEGVGKGGSGWFIPDIPSGGEGGSAWATLGDYVTALFSALWVYGGWETIGFVGGEMRNPIRDIPRVINGAMSIVVCGFALITMAMYIVLPMSLIRESGQVAVNFGKALYGPIGGVIYTIIVSCSALGSLNSNIFLTGRVVVSASRRGYFPEFLGGNTDITMREYEFRNIRQKLGKWPAPIGDICIWVAEVTGTLRWEKQVPVYAMILNAILACCYVFLGTFSAFLTFNGIAQYLLFFFAVLGVFRLRVKLGKVSSAGEKRYQTWSFNPIMFCLISAILIIRGVVTDPGQGVAVLLCVGCGWLVFRYKV